MASTVPTKIFIQVESNAEQQENTKNARKVFNNLQKIGNNIGSVDKENLIGRSPAYIAKEALAKKTSFESDLQTPEFKRKSPTTSTSSQTIPEEKATTSKKGVTVDDLTTDKVSENYWEVLAEKRREALASTLEENQSLYERITDLEQELNHSKSMLEEARDLVTVLTEMLEEKENANEVNATRGSVETEDPSDLSGNLDDTL